MSLVDNQAEPLHPIILISTFNIDLPLLAWNKDFCVKKILLSEILLHLD
jgi:hypothetical protein